MTDEEGALEANDRFYAAMNSLDISEMDEVWMDTEEAVCVHPGREAIFGYERIRESWVMIFSVTDSMTIASSNERIHVAGEVAWVACTEIISMMTGEGLIAAAAQATNIFRRTGEAWRMIVHHASPAPLTTQDEWPDLIN
ncbi:MAG TPA: nuclear transport factor 2 family protein [Pyrinomonadaceae bacterium]|jgi:ketosteroid isomerase-like protein